MRRAYSSDGELLVMELIDDPVISDSDPPGGLLTDKLFGAARARLVCQFRDRCELAITSNTDPLTTRIEIFPTGSL